MFLQNQIKDLPDHYNIIGEQISKSKEIRLIVAYVKKNGVEVIKNFINKNKNIKLLFSFDMGISDPEAILSLLDLGVEVKVYLSSEGTFHSKVWLFKDENEKWNCIVGSANLTKQALFDNVEASIFIDNKNNFNGVIEQSLIFFNFLWNSENSKSIDQYEIQAWKEKLIKRKQISDILIDKIEPTKSVEILLEFIKSWIEIDKNIKKEGVIGSLWRGWYIIPDQGYIDNELMERLWKITKLINSKDGQINISKKSKDLNDILKITSSKFVREKRRMDIRDIFIRQEKNYLLKFGLACHPIKLNEKLDKDILNLTSLGIEFSNCIDLNCIKNIYTKFMMDFTYNGLEITKFTFKLLNKLKYLDFIEFSLFIIHIYTEDEFDEISRLISIYRKLSNEQKKLLLKKYNDLFGKIKEPTGINVKGNYDKKVKHCMSAIGWCNGLKCDFEKWQLEISNV